MRLSTILTILLLTSGCASSPPIDYQAQMEQRRAELDAAANNRCTSFGYQPGTPQFNQCAYNVKMQILQMVMVPAEPPPQITLPTQRPTIQTNCFSNGYSTSCTSN